MQSFCNQQLTKWSSSLRPQKTRPARDSLRVASAAPYHGVIHYEAHFHNFGSTLSGVMW